MPGMVKVGMTLSIERTPEERAKELFTTGVAMPFTIEFAKRVKDPRSKESSLHILLEKYTDRVSPRREFFRVSPEEVRTFFDLIDGEMWSENILPNDSLVAVTEASVPFGFRELKGIRLVTGDAKKSDKCVQVEFSNLEQALVYATENNYNCVTRGAAGNKPCFYWFQNHTDDDISTKIDKHTDNPTNHVSYYKPSDS